jgi:hypothetical protein
MGKRIFVGMEGKALTSGMCTPLIISVAFIVVGHYNEDCALLSIHFV